MKKRPDASKTEMCIRDRASARQARHRDNARQEQHQANVHQVPYRHNARQERLLASDQQVLHQHSARQHQASARQEIHRASVRREASVRLIRAVSVSRIRAIREILVPCLHRRQDRMAAILLTREIPVTKIRDTTTTAVSGRPVDRAETSAETRTEKEAIITRAVTETMAARAEEMQEEASAQATARPEERNAVTAEGMTEMQFQHH